MEEQKTAGIFSICRRDDLVAESFLGSLWLIPLLLAFSALSGDQFLVWGWRIPFLLSIIMVGVGLYIRLGILETPSFRRLLAENRIERAPALEVIKRRPKLIILTAFAHMGEAASGSIYHAFVFTDMLTVLHGSRDFLLRVFHADEHRSARLDVCCHRALLRSARSDIRSTA